MGVRGEPLHSSSDRRGTLSHDDALEARTQDLAPGSC